MNLQRRVPLKTPFESKLAILGKYEFLEVPR